MTEYGTVFYYNGMFPCFLRGLLTTLFSSILNALINLARVSAGSMTSSINPRSAARYGFAKIQRHFSFSIAWQDQQRWLVRF